MADVDLKEKIKIFLNSDSGYATATKIVLATMAVTGIFFIAATAPNIFQAFSVFKKSKRYSNKQLRNAFYSLKRRGFIKVIEEKDDKIKVELTDKGKAKIKEFSIDSITIPKPKHWDKKWRMVIFDIPNKLNNARYALREKLKELNFYQLQKSAWVYPYPCQDEVLFIANTFNIEQFVEILTVESLLKENKIKRIFKL